MVIKKDIAADLVVGLKKLGIESSIGEVFDYISPPPGINNGDYAFPCFELSKKTGRNPAQLSMQLGGEIPQSDRLVQLRSHGPYLNFYINRSHYTHRVLEEIINSGESYGRSRSSSKRVVVEFSSPNTNKPLHLGHVRNIALGESISRILEFGGDQVFRVSVNNDRGVHICKSMLAYKKWGNGAQPDKKSDHFVGDYYVKFSKEAQKDPLLEEEAKEMLKKWEDGDAETMDIWRKMNDWALSGFAITYDTLGVKHDKTYFESQFYRGGKNLISEGLEKGIFSMKVDGSVVVDLSDVGLGEKVLIRSNGTSVYMTQDLFLATLKARDFNLNKSIYVVANEQDRHFRVLFEVFKRMGLNYANDSFHLSYGMVNLPEGKMKSRDGTVIDADDLIEETQSLIREQLKTKDMSSRELDQRSKKIAVAAIKYCLLKSDVSKDMLFDPKSSVSFDGNTGVYLLYTYARANSVLEKAGNIESIVSVQQDVISPEESDLVKKMDEFPEVVERAKATLNPTKLAAYAYDLSRLFNSYYHNNRIVGSEQQRFRLALVKSFKTVINSSIGLLGIDKLERF